MWDSAEYEVKDLYFTNIHNSLEVVFNHYGFDLDYVDINDRKALSQINWKNYAGATSWFTDDNTKNARLLFSKLMELADIKKPYLCLGYFGFFENLKTPNQINPLLKKFGLEYVDFYQGNPLSLKIDSEKDPKITSFERSYDGELVNGFLIKNKREKSSTYLKIFLDVNKRSSDMVVLRKGFGYAQRGFDAYFSKYIGKRVWRLNPFYAITKVFGPFEFPIPDTTTLNGKRIGYVHIDGDGFINRSKENKGKYAGEVILKRILDRYKVPTGISFINAEVMPQYRGTEESLELVKEYLTLDYLEFATHTYTHPLSWSLKPDIHEKNLYLKDQDIEKHKGPITAYKIPNYSMSYERETSGSIEEFNKLIKDPKKKMRTLYWSGNCRPPADALKALGSYLNMNGGDTRMDDGLKTYATVFPLSRKVGRFRQIYSSNSNENTYTNLWTGPFSGFARVVETFRNTDAPIRIKPSNIYYHFYSGDKKSAIKSLDTAYKYILATDHNVIFPNHFIELVEDFFTMKITKVKKNEYIIENYNKNRTLRIEASGLYPDMDKSKNIIGFKKINGLVYIHLGKAKSAFIKLTTRKQNPKVMLIEGDGVVDKLFIKDRKIVLEGYSPVDGEVVLSTRGKRRIVKIAKGNYITDLSYDYSL